MTAPGQPPGAAAASSDATIRRAAALHGAGRLAEAEALYRQVLLQAPREPNALNLLGAILIQRGAYREAVRLIEKAIAVAPRFAQAEHNLGWALQGLGQPRKAAQHYRRAIALDPKLAESHNNLGNVLIELGRRDEARMALEAAIALRPDYALAHCNLGELLRADGHVDDAVAVLRRALATHPRHFGVLNNLGLALLAAGRAIEAEDAFRHAVAADPLNAVAHNGLGSALDEQARHAEAIAAYRQALTIEPGYVAAMSNLGSTYLRMAMPGDAASWFGKALELDPANPAALDGAIVAFESMEDYAQAAVMARRRLALAPDSSAALAKVFTSSRHLADWTDPTIEARLRAAIDAALAAGEPSPLPVFDHLHIDDDPAKNRRAAEAAAATLERRMATLRRPFDFGGRDRSASRLRVGFVSYDFRDHTVGRLIGGSLGQFDRDAFEMVAYAYGRDDGSVHRRRIADSVDRFIDITADSFVAAAERVHHDGIDILVDLMGHTHNARLETFALRPAPIQATWMGMAGTTGARFIDYCIVDRTVVDESNRHGFTEAAVRLPHFWRVNDRRCDPPAAPTGRADHGLPDDAFVFASFNSSEKLDPVMFAAWMRILAATPGSVLWCRDDGAPLSNLRRRAAELAIDPSRLIGMARVDHARHLARMALADLALDTRIVNGHTTTCDTLWAGVPVLALLGRHMPGRVTASALIAAGLPELIATSIEDYEATAAHLAGDRARLRGLRDRLVAGRATSPLSDSARWVRAMERGFQLMWERYCAGGAPVGFDVPDDPPP